MKKELLKEKESLLQWLERIMENNPKDQDNDVEDFIKLQIERIDKQINNND